jgi:hypothetical protein
MSNDRLTELRDLLAYSQVQLKKCESAYKGFRAFKNSPQGLAFCASQLLQAAVALRDHAEQVVMIADVLDTMYSNTPEQLKLDDISMDEQRRRNGGVA